MKTIVYYFSGTGNSLAVAKKICSSLPDCELVPIASLMESQGTVVPAGQRVGIVCPVYFSGLPLMVAKFAERLDLSKATYTFAVVTLGETGGIATIHHLDKILEKNNGRGLDAGFFVKMPGNYIFMYGSPTGDKQKEILSEAGRQVAEIILPIERCEQRELPRSFLSGLIHVVIYPYFTSVAPKRSRKFEVTPACTSCGICAKVCPAGNIELREGRPSWKDRCEVCCACIHLCPAQAIQVGNKTKGRPRYRNPSVSVRELEVIKGSGP